VYAIDQMPEYLGENGNRPSSKCFDTDIPENSLI